MTRNAKIYIISAILPVLLLFATAAYVIHPAKYVRRIFFFEDSISGEVKSLSRYIPSGKSRNENIVKFVEDLALGPNNYMYSAVIPGEGEVNSIMYRDRTVYIDFSRETAFLEKGSFSDESFILIKKNIFFNFPFVRKIYCTIDGQIVSGGTLETE